MKLGGGVDFGNLNLKIKFLSPLDPVDKYRVRKKHPLPPANPEKHCFNDNTVKFNGLNAFDGMQFYSGKYSWRIT